MGEVTHPRVICTSGLTFTGEPQTRLNQESEDLGSSFVLEKEKKKKKKKKIGMEQPQARPTKPHTPKNQKKKELVPSF